jgi:hypothetical protein
MKINKNEIKKNIKLGAKAAVIVYTAHATGNAIMDNASKVAKHLPLPAAAAVMSTAVVGTVVELIIEDGLTKGLLNDEEKKRIGIA